MNSNSPLTLRLDNLTTPDTHFLRGLVALFTDPAHAELLRLLRAGDLAVHMEPATGQICVTDMEASLESAPEKVIQFIHRFTNLEWETVCAACDLVDIAKASLSIAETRTRDILGYLPSPRTTQPLSMATG